MALTRTLVRQFVKRGMRERWWDVTFDSSYPAGGESLTAANLGLHVAQFVNASGPSGYTFPYDHTNSKLMAFRAPGFTPAGTISAPTFTGTAPAASSGIVNDDDAAATVSATGPADRTTYSG